MPIVWLEPDTPLPDVSRALPDGLVAAGLDLSPARLLEAYGKGMFPWYSPGDPVLWWSPNPRMVLHCDQLRISRSLAKRMRQFDHPVTTTGAGLATKAGMARASQPSDTAQPPGDRHVGRQPQVTLNLAFDDVIAHCAHRGTPRLSVGQARSGADWPGARSATARDATWITPDIIAVYAAWHRMGYVHSVETWIDGRLAGGLYGVSLGRCFFGESMFSLATDASKVALAYLVRYLQAQQVPWIDCQQETPHLASLGAAPISRPAFMALLAAGRNAPQPGWGRGHLTAAGQLLPTTAASASGAILKG
ncbi:leucyl/phenylalanyl-tRNA--protein transferase [Castellaniella caeni]|uniref:leucyl/phenylalanyl-tRNA--protein transferase n=1 Tax=Castellaniella caeni TaxID=266123 RepID=UPI000A06D738|nr:leucyl/phenylalanyl-tRNA--protein transferase [Castellaniella caeni]